MCEMESSIKVSVITYVKNGIPYIKDCIKSIRNQTLKEIEILVVDAGSTDGTQEYLRQEEALDSRIKVISSAPSVGAQFNKALSMARGEYIAVCEADDYVLEEAYEVMYTWANRTDCDVLRSDYCQFYEKHNEMHKFRTHCCSRTDFYNRKVIFTDTFFLKENVNGFWSGLYKRKFLLENGIKMNETPGAAYQDMGFSFLSQYYAKTACFLDKVYYCYRLDNPAASMNVTNRTAMMIREFQKLEENLKQKRIWEDCCTDFLEWEVLALKRAYIGADVNYKQDILTEIEKVWDEQCKKNGMSLEGTCWNGNIRAYITDQDAEIKKLLDYFKKASSDKRDAVIFGAGYLGQVAAEVLGSLGKEILVVDNSTKLQGTKMAGHVIYQPETVRLKYPNAAYFIANVAHASDIHRQLLGMGIEDKDIYICNDDEILIRKILIKK